MEYTVKKSNKLMQVLVKLIRKAHFFLDIVVKSHGRIVWLYFYINNKIPWQFLWTTSVANVSVTGSQKFNLVFNFIESWIMIFLSITTSFVCLFGMHSCWNFCMSFFFLFITWIFFCCFIVFICKVLASSLILSDSLLINFLVQTELNV